MKRYILKINIFILFLIFFLFILSNNSFAADWNLSFNYNNIDYYLTLPNEFWNSENGFDNEEGYGNFFILADNNGSIYRIFQYDKYKMINNGNGDYFTIENTSDGYHILKECNDCLFAYRYPSKITWVGVQGDGAYFSSAYHVIYSTCDIKYADGTVFFESSIKSKPFISLSTTENTYNPITAYSNYFKIEDYNKYKFYISFDGINWDLMNYEESDFSFRFNYKIIKNGDYYFKLVENDTDEIFSTTWNVTNILKNEYNSGFTDTGIPQPFISYELNSNNIRLKTQSFTEDEIQRYECLHTTDGLLDYSNWDYTSSGTINNEYLNTVEYYFYIDIPINENTPETETYYFVFYDYTLNEYGYDATFNFDYNAAIEYIEKVSSVVEEKQNKFNELFNFFKERFGFLTYPFEFIADLLNRILNIDYKEPIIKIPEMYSPGTDIKIFNGYEYNFNTLLENPAISSIYNIYLIAVDFIIILGVIVLAKNTLMGVFGNG